MATNMPNLAGAFGSIYNVGPQGATGPGTNNTTWTVTGATGPTGSIWAAGSAAGSYSTINSIDTDVVIRRPGKEDIRVGDTLEILMDRLCVIQPALELLEKYPALREAYNNYKLIETMVKNGDDEDELG